MLLVYFWCMIVIAWIMTHLLLCACFVEFRFFKGIDFEWNFFFCNWWVLCPLTITHIINVWCNLYSQNNFQFYGFRSTKIEKISTIISSPDFLNTPFFYTSFLFYPECSTMPYKRSERLIDKIILYSEDHSKFRREDRLLWNLQYWNTGNRTSRWKDLSVCISEFGSMDIYHLGWRFV